MQDLHIHTIYSDGEYNEIEIIKEIVKNGITEFAICDHDTIEGSKKVSKLVNNELIFHSGVELTCRLKQFGGVNMHILARDFDFNDNNMIGLIEEISALRLKKIKRMVDYVENIYHIKIDPKKIDEILKTTKSFGKPHIYKILSSYGKFNREEFYEYMNKLDTSDLKLDAVETIKTINKTKGYATLAHPIEVMKEYNFSYKQIDKIIEFLAKQGLKGLETKHSSQTFKDSIEYSKIAKKYNLVETCGSDYHGPNVKPEVKLGMCQSN